MRFNLTTELNRRTQAKLADAMKSSETAIAQAKRLNATIHDFDERELAFGRKPATPTEWVALHGVDLPATTSALEEQLAASREATRQSRLDLIATMGRYQRTIETLRAEVLNLRIDAGRNAKQLRVTQLQAKARELVSA